MQSALQSHPGQSQLSSPGGTIYAHNKIEGNKNQQLDMEIIRKPKLTRWHDITVFF